MRAPLALAILSLIPLLPLAGCGGAQKQATAVDVAAIKLATYGVSKAMNAALAARDTAGIDSLYADDAVLLPANMPRVEGRVAIHRWWAEGLRAPDLRLVIVPGATTVAQAGDLAIEVGTYDYRATGPGGTLLHEVGKYVTVLKPVGDRWRIVTDTWNSDAPPR
jgi:ketosteroid isomerase-like protein